VKRSQRRPAAGSRSPARPGRLREPGLRATYGSIIDLMRDLTDPGRVPDAFEAEAMVGVLAGMVLQAGLDSGKAAAVLLDLVDELARTGRLHAYLGLQTLAVIGPSAVRGPAATVARDISAVAEQAGGAQAWTEQLGQVTAGACTALTDPYGETQTLLCEFAYAGGTRAHGVLATLDATWHGSVIALTIVDRPEQVRRQLHKRARREDATVRDITAPDAGVRLQAGIDALLRHGRPPEMGLKDETYGELCASLCIARHRADAMTGPAGQPPEPVDVAAQWPQDARRQVAEEFLASPYGRDIKGLVARKLPQLLITTCASQLGCDPLLTGPLLLERILFHVFPRTLLGPDRFADEIPPFMRAWTSWLAERRDMPRRHRRRLLLRLEFLLIRFPVLWTGPSANPLRRYVQDLPDQVASDGEAMFGVMERRTFAVPKPGSRGDDTVRAPGGNPARHVDALDPADENDRRLITLAGLRERGLPQQRLASHTAVIEQLWADDPAGAWAAARRMLAAGHTREAILDRLAETWKNSAQDGDRYATALGRLSAQRSR
jgi:hypothetical protein